MLEKDDIHGLNGLKIRKLIFQVFLKKAENQLSLTIIDHKLTELSIFKTSVIKLGNTSFIKIDFRVDVLVTWIFDFHLEMKTRVKVGGTNSM